MATYLRKFQTMAQYNYAKSQGNLDCPNTALIMESGRVVYTPTLISGGVGIRGMNGICYTLEEWNALAAENKPSPVGVYVYDEERGKGMIIHGTVPLNSKMWAEPSIVVPGVTTASTMEGAITDFAGETNTQAILDALEGGTITSCPVFTYARSLAYLDSSLTGYVPSAGELELIRLNAVSINLCRTAIGQEQINFSSLAFWSSTQWTAYSAWSWRAAGWGLYPAKTGAGSVITVAAF